MGVTGFVVYRSMSKQLPDPDIRKAKGRDQSTIITDRSGRTLTRLFAEQNRQDVAFDVIPAHVRLAVIATEDRRFYEHEGVDPLGIARALWIDVQKRDAAQGGSTITQQYVKQAFVTSEKTLKRKAQEAILAQRVESQFSKDEILELYLNTIYFGHGAYGIEAASRAYFGKSVADVNIAEAAVLAGVIKSPGRYSPYLDPSAGLKRRNTVLLQMRSQGHIDQTEYEEALATPIKLKGLSRGSAKAPYFIEWIKENLVKKYGERTVYRGGLRVRTTLDPAMQKAAEKTIKDVLNRKGDPSAALVAMDPKTGEVLAMVGGHDFKTQQFNVAVQGLRQPGSAFKPFVLATALGQAVAPEKEFYSGARSFKVGSQTWKVTGAHGGGKGTMRLRKATEQSVNSVYAQLILDVGAEQVVTTAEDMGITEKLTPVPAIALGGLETGVSPLEMARAYSTFATNGQRPTPFGVSKVADPSGKILMKAKPKIKQDAIDPAVAYLATDIMKGVIERGTGTSADIGRPAAGKTGTTQEYRDAWFVGYTPDLVTAVWVGYPEGQKEMTSVHGIAVTGGSFPAKIWAKFMRSALAKRPEVDFEKPDGLGNAKICVKSGGLASQFCTNTASSMIITKYKPKPCEIHTKPVEVVMPNVVGMTKLDAITKLEGLLLTVKVVDAVIEGVEPGMVAKQTPAPKSKLTPGATVTITVSQGTRANAAPSVMFAAPTKAKQGEQVTFDASASTDDGKIVRYYWEFGDNATATGLKVTHTWSSSGTFDVTLWVTDDKGKQASYTRAITIR